MGFRLIILVPVWGRPKLSRIVLSYYSNLRLKDISIRVVAAISPEDPHYRDHLSISGVHHFIHPNYPVSDKWNAAVRSTQDIDYDGLMICGSDNLATAGYIYKGCEFIRKGIDFAKASALYVYNVQSCDTFYTSLKNIGGCSFFSINAVRKCGFTLWPANRNAGIDSNISSRLLVRG